MVHCVEHMLCTPLAPSCRQAMWPTVNVSEEDRATDIGNMHKKFGKDRVWHSGAILLDRQTHKRTHHNSLQSLP